MADFLVGFCYILHSNQHRAGHFTNTVDFSNGILLVGLCNLGEARLKLTLSINLHCGNSK